MGQPSKTGLLLVGHGTRDARGLAEFGAVARQVAEQASEMLVEPCFLELAEPDIATGVGRLIERGAGRLLVAPLLLFAAGHAKRDIPEAVEEAVMAMQKAEGRRQKAGDGECGVRSAECRTGGQKAEGGRRKGEGGGQKAEGGGQKAEGDSEIVVEQLGALECNERILELSAQRFSEALAGREAVDAAETLLLMVARGSSHADAIAAMQRFAALRAERTAVACVEVCFAAIAEPSIDEAIKRAAESKFRRIVVQPHLLFTGQVLDQIGTAVEQIKSGRRKAEGGSVLDKEWIVTGHLGPSALVAEAVVWMARAHLAYL